MKCTNMNTEQAYINGFVKRASEYGVNAYQAIALLKQANGTPVGAVQAPSMFSGALGKIKNIFGGNNPSVPPTPPAAAPVRQFGMTHNALANAQNQLDSGGDLNIMEEK
jgi:hypothetical protein